MFPLHYDPDTHMELKDWIKALATNPGDKTTLGAFADWAQETGHHLAPLLEHFRDSNDSLPGFSDYWGATQHTYPQPQGNIPYHRIADENGILDLHVAPHLTDPKLALVSLAVRERKKGGGFYDTIHIPTHVAHSVARNLAESDPTAVPFYEHLKQAQHDRDQHYGDHYAAELEKGYGE